MKTLNKTQKLIELLNEFPDRELIFMYPDEGSDHHYTLGYPSKILIDDYVTIDERVWLRNEDEDELFDDIADNIADESCNKFSRNEEQSVKINAQTKQKIRVLGWKKAIIAYIYY